MILVLKEPAIKNKVFETLKNLEDAGLISDGIDSTTSLKNSLATTLATITVTAEKEAVVKSWFETFSDSLGSWTRSATNFMKEAASDVAEWTSEIADLIGATVAFLMKDAVKSASIASNSSNLFTGTGVSASEAVILRLIVLSYIINLHILKITQNTIKIFFIHFLLANTTKLQKICH